MCSRRRLGLIKYSTFTSGAKCCNDSRREYIAAVCPPPALTETIKIFMLSLTEYVLFSFLTAGAYAAKKKL